MTLTHVPDEHLPHADDVGAIFADEIAALGGRVLDVAADRGRLFGRALLSDVADVTPGDTIHGGIAIRTIGANVEVRAYTFRQVCANGAIGAEPAEARRVERAPAGTPMELVTPVHLALREALRQCAGSPAFAESIARMRTATESDPHRAMHALFLALHGMSAHAPPGWRDRVLHEVMQRYALDGDRSLFGLFNAVTSTARDEADPALRWELQRLGGALLEGATLPRRSRMARPDREGLRAERGVGALVEVGAKDAW